MIFEIIAIISTMVVIFIIQSIINSIWSKKLSKFGLSALILLLLPSSLVMARGICSINCSALVIICLIVGLFLLLRDIFNKSKS